MAQRYVNDLRESINYFLCLCAIESQTLFSILNRIRVFVKKVVLWWAHEVEVEESWLPDSFYADLRSIKNSSLSPLETA